MGQIRVLPRQKPVRGSRWDEPFEGELPKGTDTVDSLSSFHEATGEVCWQSVRKALSFPLDGIMGRNQDCIGIGSNKLLAVLGDGGCVGPPLLNLVSVSPDQNAASLVPFQVAEFSTGGRRLPASFGEAQLSDCCISRRQSAEAGKKGQSSVSRC